MYWQTQQHVQFDLKMVSVVLSILMWLIPSQQVAAIACLQEVNQSI
jgi:hypothetical protein